MTLPALTEAADQLATQVKDALRSASTDDGANALGRAFVSLIAAWAELDMATRYEGDSK